MGGGLFIYNRNSYSKKSYLSPPTIYLYRWIGACVCVIMLLFVGKGEGTGTIDCFKIRENSFQPGQLLILYNSRLLYAKRERGRSFNVTPPIQGKQEQEQKDF
jgi:hypothetical protein